MRPGPAQVEIVLDHDILDESIRALARRRTILDLGAHTPGQKQLAQFLPLLTKSRYLCTDIVFHPGLDFVADAIEIPLRDGCIDAVICTSLLEHVFEPSRVAREVYRILKPDGVAFFYLPFLYAYHGDPKGIGPVDCYRFSLDAIRYLFRDFARMRVQPVSRAVEASLRLLVPKYRLLDEPVRKLGRFVDRRRGPAAGLYQASGYNVWLEKAAPAGGTENA
jgi:SAM-dependent methyltransferase